MMPLPRFLLLSLRHSGERGASLAILTACARTELDERLTEPEVERALRDLADQRLATAFEQPIVGKRWRITALGGSTLTEAGL